MLRCLLKSGEDLFVYTQMVFLTFSIMVMQEWESVFRLEGVGT